MGYEFYPPIKGIPPGRDFYVAFYIPSNLDLKVEPDIIRYSEISDHINNHCKRVVEQNGELDQYLVVMVNKLASIGVRDTTNHYINEHLNVDGEIYKSLNLMYEMPPPKSNSIPYTTLSDFYYALPKKLERYLTSKKVGLIRDQISPHSQDSGSSSASVIVNAGLELIGSIRGSNIQTTWPVMVRTQLELSKLPVLLYSILGNNIRNSYNIIGINIKYSVNDLPEQAIYVEDSNLTSLKSKFYQSVYSTINRSLDNDY